MTPPLIVAEFEIGVEVPSARELLAAAAERGARFVAVDVVDGDDETPQAHIGERRIGALGRFADEARRRQIGLFLRFHDTFSIGGLAASLGVEKSTPAQSLRERFLVVAGTERTGKRLRRETPQFPAAYEVPADGGRGLLRFTSVNYQRAAADCDDLVVPWGKVSAAKLISRIAPDLAARGARLWISHLSQADLDRARSIPAAGFVVRCAMTGPALGG